MDLNQDYYFKQPLFTGKGIKKDLIQEECLDIAEDLYCGICQELCSDPISCQKCHGLFCKKCLDDYMRDSDSSNICPNACEINIVEINPILLKILKKIKVFCVYQDCKKMIKYEDFEQHILTCDFITYCCASNDCNFVGKENAIKKHIDQCENLLQTCSHCNESHKRKNLGQHEHECPKRILVCLFCKESMKKMELESHIEKCKYVGHLCKLCKAQIVKNIINGQSKGDSINYEEGKLDFYQSTLSYPL